MRSLLVLLAAVLMTASTVHADPVVYIAPGGNDLTGDGSSANPYRTIQRAADAVDPGGVVRIADGDYPGFAVLSVPMTLVAEGPGRPRIGTFAGTGSLLAVVGTFDLTLAGVDLVGATGRVGMTVFGPSDRLHVRDCRFLGFPNLGVELIGGTSTDVHFEDCRFESGRGNGAAAAVFGISTDALRFTRCRFVEGDFGLRLLGATATRLVDCTFLDLRQPALTAVFCPDLLIDRCRITRCAQLPTPVDWTAPRDALAAVSLVAMCDRALLRDTVVEDSGGYVGPGGLGAAGGSFDGLFGIAVEDSAGFRLENCSLHRNDYGGLLVDGVASSGVLDRCNLVDNGRYAVFGGAADLAIHCEGSLDARNTFFGLAAGPTADGAGPGNDVQGPGSVLVSPVQPRPYISAAPAGRAAFEEFAALAAPGRPAALGVADFDADGRDDVVVAEDLGRALVLHLQTGPGSFAAPRIEALAFTPAALLAADLDADGDPDVALLDADGDRLVTWIGDGQGGLLPGPVLSLPRRPERLVAVDADGAGAPELAVACRGDLFRAGGLVLVRGLAVVDPLAGVTVPAAVAALDVDRDGVEDLVAYDFDPAAPGLRLLVGDGGGGFAPGVAVGGVDPGPVADVRLEAAELDDDPGLDLAVSRFSLFPLPGRTVVECRAVAAGGGLGPAHLLREVSGPAPLAVDGYSNSGRPGVVVGLPADGSALWLGELAAAEVAYAEVLAQRAPPLAVASGEFSGAPGRDVLLADARAGTVRVERGRRVAALRGYGAGCPGTLGVPGWRPRSTPELGASTFGLFLDNVPPGSSAFLFLGIRPADFRLPGGCSLLVDLPFTVGTAADTRGLAEVSLTIPRDPGLLSGALYGQWIVVDPGGQALGALSASQGIEIRVGG